MHINITGIVMDTDQMSTILLNSPGEVVLSIRENARPKPNSSPESEERNILV